MTAREHERYIAVRPAHRIVTGDFIDLYPLRVAGERLAKVLGTAPGDGAQTALVLMMGPAGQQTVTLDSDAPVRVIL